MTDPMHQRRRIRGTNLRDARTALVLVIVLSVIVLATHSAPAQTYTVLHSFTGPLRDGMAPAVAIHDANGDLYGTTCYGGQSYDGIAFKLAPGGKETVLYIFLAGYGNCPDSLLEWKGDFYGAAANGGAYGKGAIFKLDKKGNEVVLYSFSDPPNGSDGPILSLRDARGIFYGTTFSGGSSGWGTVFKVDATGKERILYNFRNGTDGAHPNSGLVRDDKGNLYGTTSHGGDPHCTYSNGDCGTVFKLDPKGKLTTLHMFTGGADGAAPSTGLIRDASGNLYGATDGGGDVNCIPPDGCGIVFMLDSSGAERVLYRFTGAQDGLGPDGNLVRDEVGNLYGTTYLGGDLLCGIYYAKGCGTVFKLDTTGKETVLHSFTSSPDGAYPQELIRDAAGDLYGATFSGGDALCVISHSWSGCGTVFKLTP